MRSESPRLLRTTRLALLACVPGLLLAYVGSIGPVYWVLTNGYLGNGTFVWPAYVYAPVFWLEQHPPIGDVIRWYLRLWIPYGQA